jgi:HD-like signal output (HDOD) protein
LQRFREVKILSDVDDRTAMEIKDTFAPLDLELKKVTLLGGNMALVVVPCDYADMAMRAKREMDTAVRFKEYLVIGVFGMGADEASTQFLSIPKGIAVYPKDGSDAETLFFDALERFSLSRAHSPWVKNLWESIKEMKATDKEADAEGKFLLSTFYQFYEYLGTHAEELGGIVGQMAPSDQHWIEDLLPLGIVSSFKKEGSPGACDISVLMQRWNYQEKSEEKREIGKSTLRKFRNIEHLFTLPSISREIIELAGDELVAASKMAKIIEKDPVLTSRLLKVVNSAFYGFRRQINSVEHAVVILGNDEVVNLAFSIAVHQVMGRIAPKLSHLLWEHSLMVAHLSYWLGPILGCNGGNMLYTLGLLHDFGKIIFLQRGYTIGDLQAMSSLEDLASEERDTGLSHAEMGAYVAERWNLPEGIVEGLLCHHQPARATELNISVTVHVADIIAHKGIIDMDTINTAAARYISRGITDHLSQEVVTQKFEETRSRMKILLDV